MHTGKRSLFLMAVGISVALGGCATRSSVERVQASAEAADAHAADARGRADTAQASANQATGIGNNALGVGNNAMALAQTDAQRADALETDLKKANAQIQYLRHNVVYKHVKHHRHHVRHHAAPKPDAGHSSM